MNTNTNTNTNTNKTATSNDQNPEPVCSGLLIRSEHANGKASETAKAPAKSKGKRGKGNVLFGDLRRLPPLPEPRPMTEEERRLAELSHVDQPGTDPESSGLPPPA